MRELPADEPELWAAVGATPGQAQAAVVRGVREGARGGDGPRQQEVRRAMDRVALFLRAALLYMDHP